VIRKLAFLLVCWLPMLALGQGTEFPPREEATFTGPYGGVLLGRSEAKKGCLGPISGGGRNCEETALALGILGGYKFTRHWGAEIAYTDLGELEAVNQGPATGSTQHVSTSMLDLMGVGFLPITGSGAHGLSALARAGLYRASMETSVRGIDEGSNWGITYGGGLQWDSDRKWSVRASWQRYKRVGRDIYGNNNYDVLALIGLWRF